MAKYVLRAMGVEASAATPMLFITHCSNDFTGDSLLYGFQKLLGPGLPVPNTTPKGAARAGFKWRGLILFSQHSNASTGPLA